MLFRLSPDQPISIRSGSGNGMWKFSLTRLNKALSDSA
jgi:hypothetical protein